MVLCDSTGKDIWHKLFQYCTKPRITEYVKKEKRNHNSPYGGTDLNFLKPSASCCETTDTGASVLLGVPVYVPAFVGTRLR